jgi:hypothetical protein
MCARATAYFSYETRDAIKDWIAIKNGMGKRDGSTYKDDRVFPFVVSTANDLFNRACDKAGIGTRDKRTGRRVYHLHSLRKFFRTKIGLDLDVTHSLMGDSEYLDQSYLRQEQEEIAKAYLEAMPNVSVYGAQSSEIKRLEEENAELKDRLVKLESEFGALKSLIAEVLNGKVL